MNNEYWKHPKYDIVYCQDIVTPPGRAWYPALINAKPPPPPKEGEEPGKPRYEISLLLNKEDPNVQVFIKRVELTAAGGIQKFNEGRNATIGINSIFGKYGDGDKYDHAKYPDVKGCWVMVIRTTDIPETRDQKVAVMEKSLIKGGMIVRAVCTPLITGHGVSYKLKVVQLVKDDGKRFGGGIRPGADLLDDITDGIECSPEEESGEKEAVEKEIEVAAKDAASKPSKEPIAKVEKAVLGKTGKGKEAAVNLLA